MRAKETLVGLVFFVGLILLATGTLVVGRFMLPGHVIEGVAPSAEGLVKGDLVWVDGVEVGQVQEIRLEDGKDNRVRILMRLQQPVEIREGYRFEIKNSALLGGKIVSLSRGEPGKPAALQPLQGRSVDPLKSLEQIDGMIGENRDNIRKAVEHAKNFLAKLDEKIGPDTEATIASARKLFEAADRGEGTIGQLFKDDSLMKDARKFFTSGDEALASARNLLQKTEKGEGTIGQLFTDRQPFDDFKATMGSAKELLQGLKDGKGTAGKIFNETELYDRLNRSLADVEEVAKNLKDGKGTLGQLINNDDLHKKAMGIMEDLKSVSKDLKDGNGTLGKLIKSDEIYQDAKQIVSQVRKTIEDMREQVPISSFTGLLVGGF